MKESARIAATVARQKLKQVDPKNQFFNGGNLHLHVPEVCFFFKFYQNFFLLLKLCYFEFIFELKC